IVESWTLCSEDWIKSPGGVGYVEWKRRYEQLRTQFNPVQFDPAQWAEAAHEHRQGGVRRVPSARFRHRRVFLQGRLAPSGLLVAAVGHAGPQQQLRRAQVSGDVA